MMVLPELTNENVRKGMENGWCFAVSHYSNGVELNGMEEMPGFDEDKSMTPRHIFATTLRSSPE